MSGRPIKVFLVDDSAVVRQVLHALLSSYPDLQVTGVASDPLFALEKMARDWPDVIVLDLEMPRMDGITFLRKLMAERPTPVVVCSSLSERGAQATLQAMAAGAVEVIAKPGVGVRDFLEASAEVLATAIRRAAGARPAAGPRMAPRFDAPARAVGGESPRATPPAMRQAAPRQIMAPAPAAEPRSAPPVRPIQAPQRAAPRVTRDRVSPHDRNRDQEP